MTGTIAFLVFAAVALIGALNVVLRRHPVHAALWLVTALLGVAGIFLTLDAAFLAVIQVTVYAGAIMVLFLFVILLLNLEQQPFQGISTARLASAVAGLATLALIVVPLLREPTVAEAAEPEWDVPASVVNVAQYLYRDHVLAFEIVSLILLVAMIGAIHLARRVGRPEDR